MSSLVRVGIISQQIARITFKFQMLFAMGVIFEKIKTLFPSFHKFILFSITRDSMGSKKYGHVSSFFLNGGRGFFANIFSFRDPVGVKISKRFSSYKSQEKF